MKNLSPAVFYPIGSDVTAFWGLYRLDMPDGFDTIKTEEFNADFGFGLGNFDQTLPTTGTYILVLSSRIGFNQFGLDPIGPVDYSFTSVVAPTTVTPISIGTPDIANLAIPGQTDNFTFHGTSGQVLYFDARNNADSNFEVKLNAPNGDAVFGRIEDNEGYMGFGDHVPFVLSQTGTYTLTVTAGYENAATGAYSFNLVDIAQQPSLTLGATVTGALTPGSSAAIFTLNGTAGQHIFLNNLSATSETDTSTLTLFDPAGNSIAFQALVYQYAGRDIDVVLPSTGTYILLLSGQNLTNAVNYTFTVTTPANNTMPLTVGTVVNGATTAGQMDNYTFIGTAGQTLLFDGRQAPKYSTVVLTDPHGDLVFNADAFGDSLPVVLTMDGTYTLTINGGAEYPDSAPLGFELIDFAAASEIIVGNTTSGTLTPGNSAAIYKISGVAGQRIFINNLSLTSATDNESRAWFYNPNGNGGGEGGGGAGLLNPLGFAYLVYENGIRSLDVTLPSTETYYLALYGQNPTTAVNYVLDISTPPEKNYTLTPGALVSTTASAGENDRYTFTAVAGQAFVYDGRLAANGSSAALTDPEGFTVLYSVGDQDSSPVKIITTGVYMLTFTAGGGFSGTSPYSFKLIDATNPPTVTFGTSISDTLIPGNSAAVYQFNGVPGQHLLLTNTSPTSVTDDVSTITLYDPNGYYAGHASLLHATEDRNIDVLLFETGTCTLVLSGGNAAPGATIPFSFRISGSAGAPVAAPAKATLNPITASKARVALSDAILPTTHAPVSKHSSTKSTIVKRQPVFSITSITMRRPKRRQTAWH